jgi:hypothetical protein
MYDDVMNEKADMYEYCVSKFISGILNVFGIDDKPSFVRSKMSNRNEDIESILSAADYLSEEYITKKILTIFGDIDMYDDVMNEKNNADMDRFTDVSEEHEDDMFADIESQVFDEEDEEDEDDDEITSLIDELKQIVGG